MKGITKETRLESYLKTCTTPRHNEILKVIGGREMTARQIARELGYNDLNAVKPRITELKDKGIIEATGKAYDSLTQRNVAVYRRVSNG